jgi:hypothetical protein
MSVPDFKTAEVAELFEQVHGWCHPEYPFQDPLYAAGSRVAAIDYTQIVAGWLHAVVIAQVEIQFFGRPRAEILAHHESCHWW